MLLLTSSEEESFDKQLLRGFLVQWEQPHIIGSTETREHFRGLLPRRLLSTLVKASCINCGALLSEQVAANLIQQECPHDSGQQLVKCQTIKPFPATEKEADDSSKEECEYHTDEPECQLWTPAAKRLRFPLKCEPLYEYRKICSQKGQRFQWNRQSVLIDQGPSWWRCSSFDRSC